MIYQHLDNICRTSVNTAVFQAFVVASSEHQHESVRGEKAVGDDVISGTSARRIRRVRQYRIRGFCDCISQVFQRL